MQLVLEATYKDGALFLDRRLSEDKEGKKFKVILVSEEYVSAKSKKVADILAQIAKRGALSEIFINEVSEQEELPLPDFNPLPAKGKLTSEMIIED